MKVNIRIDVTKIDKTWLYKGKKGTYLDLTVHLKDVADQYGHIGFVVQQAPKAEYDAGKRGTILGNVKPIGGGKPATETTTPHVPPASPEIWNAAQTAPDDDLPF